MFTNKSADELTFISTINLTTNQPIDLCTYEYDSNGNMTSAMSLRAERSNLYTYNAANQLTRSVTLSAVEGSSDYTYDASGNMTSSVLSGVEGNGLNFTYDAKNRLTKVTKKSDGSTVAGYTYDADGRRTSKTTLTANQQPQTYYYLYDGIGQIVGLVDETGALVKMGVRPR